MKCIHCPFPFVCLLALFFFRELCYHTHGLVLIVKCLSESRLLGTLSIRDYPPTLRMFSPWAYWILRKVPLVWIKYRGQLLCGCCTYNAGVIFLCDICENMRLKIIPFSSASPPALCDRRQLDHYQVIFLLNLLVEFFVPLRCIEKACFISVSNLSSSFHS